MRRTPKHALPKTMNSVAIIGGGITGLTAAFRLKQRGIAVTVYEATTRVGGVIQTVRRNGYLAEFGPNTCLETSPRITALVRDLGLEKRKLYTDPKAENRYLVRGGKPVLMPGSAAGFFKTALFSLGAKARLFREPFIRRAPVDAVIQGGYNTAARSADFGLTLARSLGRLRLLGTGSVLSSAFDSGRTRSVVGGGATLRVRPGSRSRATSRA